MFSLIPISSFTFQKKGSLNSIRLPSEGVINEHAKSIPGLSSDVSDTGDCEGRLDAPRDIALHTLLNLVPQSQNRPINEAEVHSLVSDEPPHLPTASERLSSPGNQAQGLRSVRLGSIQPLSFAPLTQRSWQPGMDSMTFSLPNQKSVDISKLEAELEQKKEEVQRLADDNARLEYCLSSMTIMAHDARKQLAEYMLKVRGVI